MPWEALCAEVAKLRVDPPVKDESEAMQKAVGSDLEPASLTTELTTILTTVLQSRMTRLVVVGIKGASRKSGWWRRRESNPGPNAFSRRVYMLSVGLP